MPDMTGGTDLLVVATIALRKYAAYFFVPTGLLLDTGRTSSADPERRCLQKEIKICTESGDEY